MKEPSASCILLMADDDREDCLLARIAFEESGIEGEICFVEDGEELLAYFQSEAPRPDLIILDLNMPRKDGRKALLEIKSDRDLKDIPIMVLTTSRNEKDVKLCMDAGACDFRTKPVEMEEWVEIIASSVKSHCK